MHFRYEKKKGLRTLLVDLYLERRPRPHPTPTIPLTLTLTLGGLEVGKGGPAAPTRVLYLVPGRF